MEDRIRLFRPTVGDAEKKALCDTIDSRWLGNGPRTIAFEERFAEFVGAPHAVAVNSATAALHLGLLCAEVEGQEVLTSTMTFVSSTEAILLAGGRPVFCDVEPDTLNISIEDMRRKITPTTRAVVITHYGGHACDMDPILELAAQHGLSVIEDTAHGCGGTYRQHKLGTMGTMGCYSFQATKNMTTGDGGMLVTADENVADRVRKLRWCGITAATWERFREDKVQRKWMYEVEEVGWKYEMTDLAAALGLAQLDRLEAGNARRQELMQIYREAFAAVDGIDMLAQRDYAVSACYNAVVRHDDREGLHAYLDTAGIDSNVHFYPNHMFRLFRPYTTHLPVAEREWQRILSIPLHPELTDADQTRVIDAVRAFAQGASRQSVAAR